jgi:hypothetical protein
MAKINSKETKPKLYTLRVTNKLVSEEAIRMIGELTRLHAKKRIQLDPKSYEGLPLNYHYDNFPNNDEWTTEEWDNYWERKDYIESKEHDISLANGGFTIQEAHWYRDKHFK